MHLRDAAGDAVAGQKEDGRRDGPAASASSCGRTDARAPRAGCKPLYILACAAKVPWPMASNPSARSAGWLSRYLAPEHGYSVPALWISSCRPLQSKEAERHSLTHALFFIPSIFPFPTPHPQPSPCLLPLDAIFQKCRQTSCQTRASDASISNKPCPACRQPAGRPMSCE